jgi:hypothetical protein
VVLAHYRSVLKNKGIVDEAEKILQCLHECKPIMYDVSTHVKAIEMFETREVRPPSYSSSPSFDADFSTRFTRECARCARHH